ncbi:hypothetical protein C8F04DRAFT_241002 [Mycena alexandri]|uniref:Uncharacterized protein n=1 Tax=Mycena alexandri TaxID=1745969 RepID=A0AAD6SBD4_9AGAR|nr:hypothetical protein C8F04DRAFT_241002 [Mycena alexandri]
MAMATARTRSLSSCSPHNRRSMKKRRLSFQAIFAGKDSPDTRNYKTLPRSFGAAYAAYYDAPFDAATLPVSAAADTPLNNTTDDSSSFLLDDDPFADLTGGPRAALDNAVSLPAPDSPSSPLHSPTTLPAPAPPPVTRTMTAHATPAHQKPAFRPRPSLPSLHTLAQMSVVVPHKVRVFVFGDASRGYRYHITSFCAWILTLGSTCILILQQHLTDIAY